MLNIVMAVLMFSLASYHFLTYKDSGDSLYLVLYISSVLSCAYLIISVVNYLIK